VGAFFDEDYCDLVSGIEDVVGLGKVCRGRACGKPSSFLQGRAGRVMRYAVQADINVITSPRPPIPPSPPHMPNPQAVKIREEGVRARITLLCRGV